MTEHDLLDAVSKRQRELVIRLLAGGIDANAIDPHGLTPLMLAAKKGFADLALILVEAGAEVNAMANYYGWTALAYAANGGHEGVVRLLLNHRADPVLKAERGKTPLVLAADRGHLSTGIALLEGGAEASAPPDHHGWTALGRAERHGHANCVGSSTRGSMVTR